MFGGRATTRWGRLLLLLVSVPLSVATLSPPAGASHPECPVHQLCGIGTADLENPAIDATAINFVPGADGTYEYPTGESIFADCIIELVVAGDGVSRFGPLVTANLAGSIWTEDYWVIDCGNDSLVNLYFYEDGPPPPAWVVDDMIADAYSRTPVLAFNPITSPDGDEAISLLVHIPTYLWVDSTAWAPVSATATIPGGFSVTTTATPAQADWTGGESPVTCTETDMIPYNPALGEDGQLSNCSTHYRYSSATHEHTIDLEVTWTVVYTCSTGTCGGPLPSLTTASTREVIVKEIQAVGTPNP